MIIKMVWAQLMRREPLKIHVISLFYFMMDKIGIQVSYIHHIAVSFLESEDKTAALFKKFLHYLTSDLDILVFSKSNTFLLSLCKPYILKSLEIEI